MARVLVCWVGNTDLDAARGVPAAGLGPIGLALSQRAFDEVYVLSNYPKEKGEGFVRWATSQGWARLQLRQVELQDPTHFASVYKLADAALTEIKQHHKHSLELTLHISPGTPVMCAVWVILGKTKYPAELIQASPQRGLQVAAIPLDIAAEFVELLPELLKRPDAALEARSTGALPDAPKFGDIVYRGAVMREVITRARRVAARSVTVLLEGESGTGKELLARAIHAESPRRDQPFIAVNCGALPSNLVESLLFGHKKGAFTGAVKPAPGYFRQAERGTLFLDEVGELPLEAQVKLLRVLQEKAVTPVGDSNAFPINVRVIAATHRSLPAECRAGRFREDLFYRLAIAVLRLPPLRERKGDLTPLIDALLAKANAQGAAEEPGYEEKTLSAGAKNLLLSQPWPGNVRELENTLMRATVWTEGTSITERHVRAAMPATEDSPAADTGAELEEGFNLDAKLAEISTQYVKQALEVAQGNKSRAAELLGLHSRQTLNNRMKSLGLIS